MAYVKSWGIVGTFAWVHQGRRGPQAIRRRRQPRGSTHDLVRLQEVLFGPDTVSRAVLRPRARAQEQPVPASVRPARHGDSSSDLYCDVISIVIACKCLCFIEASQCSSGLRPAVRKVPLITAVAWKPRVSDRPSPHQFHRSEPNLEMFHVPSEKPMVPQRQDDAERAGIKSARGFDLPPEVRGPTIHVKNRRPE